MEMIDQQSRERFTRELDRNFSVIASAGSGKTRAITDRIVQIAQDRRALEWLPKLVVVTYTNRAADEMQQRTRQRILEAGLPLEVIEAFNRAFFGTIHSFCVKLLATHGHHLGLPTNLELITDDEDLWNDFVQQQTTIGRSLSAENRRVLLRFVQARQLMELSRKYDVDLTAALPDTPCPDTSFAEVYAAVAKGQTLRTIPKAKADLERWEKRWRETDEFVPWPPCASSARDFVRVWREAFRPLREWVNACALCVAAEVQRDYRDFRLARGAITYADQVALAGELMRLPEVARRIRESDYRVILDEAQDTDPQQFFVLIEIVRPPEATAAFIQDRQLPPQPGRFCMVGDFQQSIYRDPADLARYRALHKLLVETKAAEELTFSVTFRLDRAQLDFVNQTFGEILNNIGGQVQFVELNPRADVLPGQVVRLDLGQDVDLSLPEPRRATMEARELAKWIRATGPEKLRADSWRQIAILCPRKAWLRSLRDALLDVDLAVEIQSESDRQGENPAYAWLTALLAVMVDSEASYEIVGVLREIFGLSDDELARFGEGYPARFQIGRRIRERGTVPEVLNLLARTREAIAKESVFSAVQETVRSTNLRERLRSLPPEEYVDLSAELDALLNAAANAEADGSSLADFANNLRANFGKTRETRPSFADAIQLITAHKAKGSEWQAVILPFLSRKVWGAPVRYPRAIKSIEAESAQIIFDRTDVTQELEQEIKDTERQEMERLLYVALTRAKHTLVLTCDCEFFLTSSGQVASESQMKWLRADASDTNAKIVAALPGAAQGYWETMTRQPAPSREEARENLDALRLETGWVDIAQQKASLFIRTSNPSLFAPEEQTAAADVWKEEEPELRPATIDNPAMRYGVWWHEFVQQVPWSCHAASWDEVFTATHESSPDMARSAREWRLLRERISNLSDFASRFANGAPVVHAEMPFFWRMDERRCLEGIVDLAIFDPNARKWLILDWKTNRVPLEQIDILRAQYRPQIAAYWKAVSEMTSMEVDAAIYSTPTAAFLLYNPEELAPEWERLTTLPPEDFAAKIAVDLETPPVQLEFSAFSDRARRG
jgi:ATP-dependent helicase/nuclease subunit A